MKWLLILSLFASGSCKVRYQFQDTDTGEARTALIRQFTVNAPLAPPTTGQLFSIQLQDVVQSQSQLNLISEESADIIFDGSISGYSITPVSVQQGDVTAQNRLLITVQVSFTNKTDPKKSYEQSFTRFADFASSTDITAVQDQLLDEIFQLITQDVFNRAFSNW